MNPSKHRPLCRFALLAALVLVQFPAAAERVFFDDFNSEAGGGTAIFQQDLSRWDVLGYVDVIGVDNTLGYTVDSTVIDLGGGLSGGFITTKETIRYEAGSLVTISWDMGGNQIRPLGEDIPYLQFFFEQTHPEGFQEFEFIRGTEFFSFIDFPAQGQTGPIRLFDQYFAYSYGLMGDYPITRQTLSFLPVLAGAFKFQLGTYSGGGYGPLIDNFAVDVMAAPIPEPATWGLMALGLAAMGAHLRRRRAGP